VVQQELLLGRMPDVGLELQGSFARLGSSLQRIALKGLDGAYDVVEIELDEDRGFLQKGAEASHLAPVATGSSGGDIGNQRALAANNLAVGLKPRSDAGVLVNEAGC